MILLTEDASRHHYLALLKRSDPVQALRHGAGQLDVEYSACQPLVIAASSEPVCVDVFHNELGTALASYTEVKLTKRVGRVAMWPR